ncbi:MAG: hypothetical protein LBP34_05155 [Flavobacteriaceae bacterium]|jgi:hypothetical protein|nr:hypothetical protein [Flavobacteriaceae bacterium]
MKKVIILLVASLFSASLYSQKAERLDFNLDVKSNHLWRGIKVTDAAITAVDINYALDDKKYLKLGVWGGAGLSDADGVHYHEIDYYLNYSTGKFGIGIWDVFNSTGFTGEKADIWNYDQDTTGHRLDLRGYVVFAENFPLRLEYGTSFYGNDLNGKGDQRFSSYAELNYPAIKGKAVDLNIFCGAGFGLTGDSHFYGNEKNNFDIVNVGITASKNINALGYKLPVSATVVWNPSVKQARIQIAASLF